MLRAAVLGSPISHSRSPDLHRAAYAALGLPWQYDAIECTKEQFPEFLAGLDEQWRGLSLTMPLKEVVLDVVEDVEEIAQTVRSANTVWRNDESSSWRATNTDIAGMRNALAEVGVTRVERVRILGAGATSRSAAAAAVDLGATMVTIHARREEAARDVAILVETLGGKAEIADLSPDYRGQDLLISTLPADIARPWATVAESPRVPAGALLDASYHPWPTPLATAWAECFPGLPVASGRDMLLWQAVDQVRLMTGAVTDENRDAVVSAMRAALSTG